MGSSLIPSLALATSAVPLLYIVVAAPFVTLIHIRLPSHARISKDALSRFVERLPSDTKLGFTTISWYGWPRTTTVLLSELQPTSSWLGIHNIVRKNADSPFKLRFWQKSGQSRFFVGQSSTRSFESTIWDKVSAKIQNKATAG